eukprot:CAMPEP_0113301306 /NCGR_PEP_ID=MMETSP0010_2-20120614/2589_1 /TAXON_ID=216773 ORGANISM="Corethron hystrix, Strain 308" /NCGR_SAMPLE_ID=MMETSP0010_2 /ASSEMBLY_ACC=CAM_ASM_000155 /LENGTH=140 /DNA_ID=CAMNT_0000154905 /DNA_START=64 /DNA_END=486 /DNA_ORIENTATION=- /assembly_acc=CAM_ASM_000155
MAALKPESSAPKAGDQNVSKTKTAIESEAGVATIDDLFASKRKEKIKRKELQNIEEAARKDAEKKRKCDTKTGTGRDRSSLQSMRHGEFVDDGLGGVYDKEGYTGRTTDDGMKIFKAHLFNKESFGSKKDCPFDCDCCFI